MKADRFEEVVNEQLNNIVNLLVNKQREYNPDTDKLSVFKHGAAISGETSEQVLYGFLLKHLISQADMIKSDSKFTKERWQEKVLDIISYNILLLALLEDDGKFDEKKD